MPKCTLMISLQVDGASHLNSTGVFELDSVEVITKAALASPKATDKHKNGDGTTGLKAAGDRESIDLLAITTDGAPVKDKPVTLREVVKRRPLKLKAFADWDEAGRIYRGNDAKAVFDLLADGKLVIDNKRPSDVTVQVTIGRKFG